MVFKLRWNRWQGKKTAQLVIEDLRLWKKHQPFFLAIRITNYYYTSTAQKI
jgi:hypothetical protein